VHTVLFSIYIVVENINCACHKRESQKCQSQIYQQRNVKKFPCKKRRDKNEKVLYPLVHPAKPYEYV
jgi:hypothetical protein